LFLSASKISYIFNFRRRKTLKIKKLLIIFFLLTAVSLFAVGPYADNDDGTVTDTSTNLRWRKCSRGQTNDATCTGAATIATWQQALQYCNGLTQASKSWRLPSVNELQSLVKYAVYNPSIEVTKFPATIAGYYWSATTYASSTTYAWLVYFYNGYAFTNGKTGSYYARCVSPGP
jgi:hypothetical protein